MDMEVKKIVRERDDFSDEASHLRKRMQKMEEEHQLFRQRELEMKRDLEDARVSVSGVREFE